MRDREIKTLTRVNIAAWNQVASIHKRHNHDRLRKGFESHSFLCLDDLQIRILKDIGIDGKDVAQICCGNARELISIKRMGARRCVGFDGAAKFIEQAHDLKDGANADLELVCTEVYDIPDSYNNCFDVLVITVGVLVWLPDISKVFAILNRLLKSGGHLFIHEQHPILEMISLTEGEDDPIIWEISYFHKGPFVEWKGLDYYRNVAYDAKPTLSFSHTLADTIMSGINNGLVLKDFNEYADNISLAWPNVEKSNIGLPMSYSMVFQKPGKGEQEE